ncbi:succinate dehydrogenase, cytochrome b556 subunit [Pontibaca methylaminivorans]|uniref:Succinate dehydrogenase cytochrome b556 subunit n=1 Tax=Pontibaca methylaminivorans TaxID=515897 RepID=A0A1R3WJ96_9RHOB|nr:succinate dehydrogenase, cytochrome b556 subunit [Pontibaca methylaminivorans]SIT78170.1 succinate dehydrogenase subunit C [Pontibaca methylaminivorans]
MSEAKRVERPLSPFMLGSAYRIQMTSFSSIVTRITGNALGISAILFVWWLLAAATSPEAFARADGILTGIIGDVVMTLTAWGLWYHYLAGLRHLYWDTGRGMELRAAERLGWAVVIGSVLLTVLTIIVI